MRHWTSTLLLALSFFLLPHDASADRLSWCPALFNRSTQEQAFEQWRAQYQTAHASNDLVSGAEALARMLLLKNRELKLTRSNKRLLKAYSHSLHHLKSSQLNKIARLAATTTWSMGPFVIWSWYKGTTASPKKLIKKLNQLFDDRLRFENTLNIPFDDFANQIVNNYFKTKIDEFDTRNLAKNYGLPFIVALLSNMAFIEPGLPVDQINSVLEQASSYVNPVALVIEREFPLYESLDYLTDIQNLADQEFLNQKVSVISDQKYFGDPKFFQNPLPYPLDASHSQMVQYLSQQAQSLEVHSVTSQSEFKNALQASSGSDVVIINLPRQLTDILPYKNGEQIDERLSRLLHEIPFGILKEGATLVLSGQAFANRTTADSPSVITEPWVKFGRYLLGNSGTVIAPTNFIHDRSSLQTSPESTSSDWQDFTGQVISAARDVYVRSAFGPYLLIQGFSDPEDILFGHGKPGFRTYNFTTQQDRYYVHAP